MSEQAFQFPESFVHLGDGGAADPLEVTPTFWADIAAGRGRFAELGPGRLVSWCEFDGDWPNWEIHPEGEELVCLISGEMEFVLEQDSDPRSVILDAPGAFLIVPRGVWHTARVTVPSRVLFVTAGDGTRHRPA